MSYNNGSTSVCESIPQNYIENRQYKLIRPKSALQIKQQILITQCLFKLFLIYQTIILFLTFCQQAFLYSLWYFTFSVMGNFNNFFFAAHLLDVAVGFKTLRTILQSVTHNGKQVNTEL